MVLNALWLLVTQQGWIWVSVGVIAALVVTLGLIVRRLTQHPSYGTAESLLVDGTFGLYLGWVAVATCANVTAALVASGVDPGPTVAAALGVAVLAVAALGSVASWPSASTAAGRWRSRWRGAWARGQPGRAAAEPRSVVVGLAALVAALVVLSAAAKVQRDRAAA